MRFILGGDIGLADSYGAGDWTTPDLTALLSWAMQNEDESQRATGGTAVTRTINRIRYRRREKYAQTRKIDRLCEVRERTDQLPINEPYLVEVTELLRVISGRELADPQIPWVKVVSPTG